MAQGDTKVFNGQLYYEDENGQWLPYRMNVVGGGSGGRGGLSRQSIINLINQFGGAGLTLFKTTIPALRFQTNFSDPITLLPAPGPNKYYAGIVKTAAIKKLAATIVYNFAGDNTTIGYTPDNLNPIWTFNNIFLNPTPEYTELLLAPPIECKTFVNQPLFLCQQAGGADATQGDGDVIITFLYSIMDLS